MKKIIALYDAFSHAQQAATRLAEDAGLDPKGIELEPREAARRYLARVEEGGGDLPDQLLGPHDEVNELSAGGGALLAVSIPDDMEEPVLEVLDRYGLVDLQIERGGRLRSWRSPKERREGAEIDVRPEVAFKRHHQARYAPKGWDFEMFAPAYAFGYGLAGRGVRDWETDEQKVKQLWEREQLGEWEQFEDAVHYGWVVAVRGVHELDKDLENADLETTRRGEMYQELNEE